MKTEIRKILATCFRQPARRATLAGRPQNAIASPHRKWLILLGIGGFLSDLEGEKNKNLFLACFSHPTICVPPSSLAEGVAHSPTQSNENNHRTPFSRQALSRNDVVEKGSARVPRAIDGVSPAISLNHLLHYLASEVCKTKFAARRRKPHASGVCWMLLILSALALPALGEVSPTLACDREMRKTFESIQAWRRSHNGEYPARLADLKLAGLLPRDGAICPEVLRESPGASATHGGVSSRADSADPPGTYEYEMSAKVDQYENDKLYLPLGATPYTRQDLKAVLLRRPFFEQVPILRCSSHREVESEGRGDDKSAFRNMTVAGKIYWSGFYWEQLWLDDVPLCARGANVLFGLKGPPFYTDRVPASPQMLDLRKWDCAFGDQPWWWDLPMFQEQTERQRAADLQPFFQENHGHVLALDGADWWLDGLVQLQGRVKQKGETLYEAPGLLAFSWEKTGAAVGRKFARATWLQGTVWSANAGETVGWLVWHYQNADTSRVPIIYGTNTARFWAEPAQAELERNSPKPVWSFHQTQEAVGRERWLRIYRQEWTNPQPEMEVASLDFVSNPQCRAAPFLIAVDVLP